MSTEERKEKVLHTRIPVALEDQIKRLAEALRVPVSNLVRNMLEDAIDVTRRVRDRVPEAMGVRPAPPDATAVFGWQALTLNVATPCAMCSRSLARGDQAYLGMTDLRRDALNRVLICPACLPRPGRSDHAT